MKKKLLLAVVALGVFFISSCESIQDLLNDNPRNLGFVQKELKADAATAGVTAGNLSADGGNGALTYSLVPGVGDEDNEFFAVEGAALKIKKESLEEYDYSFRVEVRDGKGQAVEDSFTLKVGPPDESGKPENPNEGGDPDDSGEQQTPGEPENPQEPEIPDGPELPPDSPDDPGESETSVEPETPDEPAVPDVPDNPDEPGEPETPGGPKNPDNPAVPEAPAGPDNPDDPGEDENPVEPENPDVPDVPEAPAGPDNPDDPGGPENPDEPGGPVIAKPARAGNLESKLGMQLIELSWTAAARATSYEVYYSEGDNFATATKFAVESTEPAVTVTGLEDGTVYNFWVVAKNSAGAATESRAHTALRTSDTIPDYLRAGMIPGGPQAIYSASNFWPGGDVYRIRDLGEDYPAHERYAFSYDGNLGNSLYPGGVIKFVRKFGVPANQSTSGENAKGCIIYQFESLGRKRFQATYYGDGHLPPTVRKDYQNHPSHPPAAIMGQANGYSSGLGNAQVTDTLEEAITKYAHEGGGPIGTGGMTDYFTPMAIYYCYNPDYYKN
jgi:hypothetical protein